MSSVSLGDDSITNNMKDAQKSYNNSQIDSNSLQEKSEEIDQLQKLSIDEEIKEMLNDEVPDQSHREVDPNLQHADGDLLEKTDQQISKYVLEYEENKTVSPLSKSQSPSSIEINKEVKFQTPSNGYEGKTDESSKISAYARLDFEDFTFFVQTLQVVLGRKSNDVLLGSQHAVDVHLSSKKAISRRHAKIFYNFGTQRFELSILGRNGAFVDDLFVEKGITVPLMDGSKIQIGDISFVFVLPSVSTNGNDEFDLVTSKPFNPSDAVNLRSNIYDSKSPTPKMAKAEKEKIEAEISQDKKSVEHIGNNKPIIDEETKEKPKRLSMSVKRMSAASEDFEKILKELNEEKVEGNSLINSQIERIFGDENDIEESNLMKLAEFNESAIDDEDDEDEIDKLVHLHNMEQEVSIEDEELTNIDMSLSLLDQEIATLAPLIDAHHQDLMKEKEEKRNKLELEKKKKQQLKKNYMHIPQQLPRTTPLMGKPAMPRMGRPASIQPTLNRLYGRQVNGLTKTQIIDNRLTTTTLTGLPTHLVSSGGLPLKISQGISMVKPMVPRRPPPPKLEVPVNFITLDVPKKTTFPAITISTDIEVPNFCEPKLSEEPSTIPKLPRKKKDIKKPNKSVYNLEDIPEQYRIKPTLSYPIMVTNVLKSKSGESGLTILEINDAIKEIYPYYKYCPDGWQYSVSHNVKLNMVFKKLNKNSNNEWTWTIDESFVSERERVRKKQQELAAAKAKAAAIKAEELKQKQRLEVQQAISNNIVGRNFVSPYGSNIRIPQTQFISLLHHKPATGEKPKTIAELASEIRRDGLIGSKAPLYFKPQSTLQMNSNGELVRREDIPASITGTSSLPINIKAQLAANRSQSPPSPAPVANEKPKSASPPTSMNQDTKKSLSYLQKELFTLYKARKLSYNTATTTEIITKALATTIAQVNVIGAKAGCGDNALSFLVEKAPQQVSKILDIALTKSIKEKQGSLPSRLPAPATPAKSSISTPTPTEATLNTPNIKPETDTLNEKDTTVSKVSSPGPTTPTISSTLSKPPLFNSARIANKAESPSLTKPPNFTHSLSKPQSFSKPGGLSKPPQFLSNKPSQAQRAPPATPSSNTSPATNTATIVPFTEGKRELKRENDSNDNVGSASKALKLE